MKRSGDWFLGIFLPVIILFCTSNNGFTAPAILPEIIVLPFTSDSAVSNGGIGSGIQYLLENMLAVNSRVRETWFFWHMREIFKDKAAYDAFLQGETGRVTHFLNSTKWDRRILSGSVSRDGEKWQIRLVFGNIKHPRSGPAADLWLDFPTCHNFREEVISFLTRCGFPFATLQKKNVMWSETFSISYLAALGKAYEAYCSRLYGADPAQFDATLFERLALRFSSSYLALTLNGWASYHAKHLDGAIAAFRQALNQNPHGHDAQNGLMWTHARLKKERKTIFWGKQAGISRGESGEKGAALALSALAYWAFQRKEYEKTLDGYAKALEILYGLPGEHRLKIAQAHDHMGIANFQLQRHDAAAWHLNRALAIRENELGLTAQDNLNTLLMIAKTCRAKGEYDNALHYFRRVLRIRESSAKDTPRAIASALTDVGQTLNTLGRYAESLNYHEKALDLLKRSLPSDHPRLAESFHSIGIAYQMTGAYGNALAAFENGLVIRLKTHGQGHSDTAVSYNDIGTLYERMGDAKTALAQYEKAISALHGNGADNGALMAAVYHNKATALQRQGQNKDALTWHKKALAIRKAIWGEHHLETALSYNSMGCLKSAMDDYEGAIADLKKALSVRKRLLGEDHPLTAAVYFNLGTVFYFKGQTESALHYGRIALMRSAKSDFRELTWRIFDLLREVFRKKGHLSAAAAFGKTAVNTIQRMRTHSAVLRYSLQTGFLMDKLTVYERLARILIELGRFAEAQDILMLLKQEEYFDFIGRDRSVVSSLKDETSLSSAESGMVATYLNGLKQLSDVEDRLIRLQTRSRTGRLTVSERKTEERLRQLRTATLKTLDKLVEFRAKAPPDSTAASIRTGTADIVQDTRMQIKQMKPDTAMLHYLSTEEKLLIMLSTHRFQAAREIAISAQNLNRLTVDYLKKVNRVWPDTESESKRLYDVLFAPVADELKKAGVRTILVYFPRSALRYLPIAALFDGEAYLAETYAFIFLTSVHYERRSQQDGSRWRVAGLGTSAKVSDAFNALPYVKDELDRIIFENDEKDKTGIYNGVLKLNAQFTPSAMREVIDRRYPVLHIATHFACNIGNASDSFLLLGDGSRLTLSDVQRDTYRFDGIDLVTLSACRTAIGGQDGDGREFESLGTLVQKKGAESVIASLWPVSDQSTPLLMEKMYALCKNERSITKAEALRQTQVWFLKTYRPDVSAENAASDGTKETMGTPIYRRPYFWAPFVLMEHL